MFGEEFHRLNQLIHLQVLVVASQKHCISLATRSTANAALRSYVLPR
jgi:hypothetical protein